MALEGHVLTVCPLSPHPPGSNLEARRLAAPSPLFAHFVSRARFVGDSQEPPKTLASSHSFELQEKISSQQSLGAAFSSALCRETNIRRPRPGSRLTGERRRRDQRHSDEGAPSQTSNAEFANRSFFSHSVKLCALFFRGRRQSLDQIAFPSERLARTRLNGVHLAPRRPKRRQICVSCNSLLIICLQSWLVSQSSGSTTRADAKELSPGIITGPSSRLDAKVSLGRRLVASFAADHY